MIVQEHLPDAAVLVVDDSAANLVALSAVLQPLRVRIIEARSGPEAIEQVALDSFAVVLLDVQMPGMDGFEVAKRLKENARSAELPIIFLTAIHRDELYARRGYAAGGADYMTKPYDADVLRARVKAFVDLYHQRERVRLVEVGARTKERDDALEQLAVLLESERAARREAEAAARVKDEFLATISHELRTPLTAILGWSVLARNMDMSPEVRTVVATIERNSRAQMRIIEDILDISRITSGNLRLELAETSIESAIQGAVEATRPAATAKDIELTIDIDRAAGKVIADAQRLQQIVWNVMSNAIKFTPPGGRVGVNVQRSEAYVTISVHDSGEGITPEFLPRLFEAFKQADSSASRRHGGLGLGLAIVQQLVHAHGGRVTAKSDGLGKGATFVIELPTRTPPSSSVRIRPADDHSSPLRAMADEPEHRLDGVRVLIIDDDSDTRELLQAICTNAGAAVFTAASAEQALHALDAHRPDVILSDIAMPDIDGLTLIRHIRKFPRERGGNTPAVCVTASAQGAFAKEDALAWGFQAHVPKPIEPRTLVSVIASLVKPP